MKDYSKLLSGLAGECGVMKELCLKGWVPSLAYNNCPTFDIFCHNPITNQTVAIQVKTVREKIDKGKIGAFPLMGNRDERQQFYNEVAGPYVFVYIDKLANFEYYILSKEQFITTSSKVEYDYDNLDRSKPIKLGSPMAMPKKEITQYKDCWDNLWL